MADLWLCADSTVSGGAFTTTSYEDDAVALEGMGHTVTRVQTSTISSAPLTSDCDCVVVINGTPGGETLLRAIATDAAPIVNLNSYNLGNAWGSLAIASGAPGTDDGSNQIVVTNNTAVTWTAGYAVNDTVTIAASSIYMERVNSPVSGAAIMLRSTTNIFAYVTHVVPSGTTNLASQVTTANIATFHIFDNIKNLNAAGEQILNDLIIYAIGLNAYEDTPAFTAAATMTVADAQGRFDTPAFTAAAALTATSLRGLVDSPAMSAAASLAVVDRHAPVGIDATDIVLWGDASSLSAGVQVWSNKAGSGLPAIDRFDLPAVIENASGVLSAFDYNVADTEYHFLDSVDTTSGGESMAVAFRADSVSSSTISFGNESPLLDWNAWFGFSLHKTGGVAYATPFAYDTAYRYGSSIEIVEGRWYVATLVLNAARSTLTLRIDGDTEVQITGLTGQTQCTGYYIGTGSVSYFDGAVGEVVASHEELSGGSLTSLETYLTDKWLTGRESLALSLSATMTVSAALNGEEDLGFGVGASLSAQALQGYYHTPAFTVDAQMAALLAYADDPGFTLSATFVANDEQFEYFLYRYSPATLLTGSDSDFSRITWSGTDDPGADVVVEVSYDNSTWYRATNGAALPNLPADVDGETLYVRQVFRSVDGVQWGSLSSLHVEVGEPMRIESGSISYSYTSPKPGETSQSQVKRTASLLIEDPLPAYADVGTAIFKPYVEMQAPSTGNWVRFYLGEFESLAPPKNDDGTRITANLRLASREQKLSRVTTTDYVVAPVNRNIVLFVREDVLVDEFGESDFDFPTTTDTIPDDIVFPPGTTWLEVVNTALESVGWSNLVVNGDGQWTAGPATIAQSAEWVYPTQTPVVRAASIEPFIGDIPNVVVVKARRGPSLPVEGNGQITIKNLATGPFSIAGRGGLEVSHELSVEAADQAELERIGVARAEAMFRGGGDRLQLTVGLNPLHDERDSVQLTKDRFGITAERFWVSSWSMELGRVESMATMGLTLDRQVVAVDASAFGSGGAASSSSCTPEVTSPATSSEVSSTTDAAASTSNAQGVVTTA